MKINMMSETAKLNLVKWVQSHGNTAWLAGGRIAIKSAVRLEDGSIGFETEYAATKQECRAILGY